MYSFKFCSNGPTETIAWYVSTSWIPCQGGGFKRGVNCVQCVSIPYNNVGVQCPGIPVTMCNPNIKPIVVKDGCDYEKAFNSFKKVPLKPKA